MKTNRAVIIQCRLSSTRLPNKALKPLGNKSVLEWVLLSMHKVKADRYFVATDDASYEKLKPICDRYKFECFAGNLEDVLKRFCDLIKTIDVKTIIRATADNPFLFYEAAQESVEDFENRNKGKLHCDYLTWTGLPHGSGVEVFSAQSLLKAADQTTLLYDHEHVGPALYNHQDNFKCEFVKAPQRFNHPQFRTTIDTYSDYLRAISIVNYLGIQDDCYTTEQILSACNAKQVVNPVVLVPSVTKGYGTGHLRRCLEIALNTPFFIYIPNEKTLEETDYIVAQYVQKGLATGRIINQIPDQTYLPLIITDSFELTQKQLEVFNKNRGLIAIDDGSKLNDYFDYILDIIPSYEITRTANFTNPNFITKPQNKKETQANINNIEKILICLGGEDPHGFTIPAVLAVADCYPQAKITAIISQNASLNSFNGAFASLPNVEVIEPVQDLREQLYAYDLVITHYGFTAFEAFYAGCGVILLPTTKLHLQLAQKYDFAFIPDENINTQVLLKALASKNVFNANALQSSNAQTESLPYFLQTISYGTRINCPVCDRQELEPNPVIARNSTRTYRRCSNCGIIYMSWSSEAQKEYKKSYFFDEYKNQYGKTYQEDFESIKLQGLRRLDNIIQISFSTLKDKNLLDIGCAYGPFMAAALDYKLNPYGTDISQEAVTYVQEELHLPASRADFPDLDILQEFGLIEFDVITMWYVIEHFKNLDIVLRKVNSMLKKGGIFAFSTPSGEGISAKSNKEHFYQISPSDHYTIWEPSGAAKILSKYGFEVVRIVSTGHHPERFPAIKKLNAKKDSLQWKLTEQLSRIKKLGDTCEIYCRKIK